MDDSLREMGAVLNRALRLTSTEVRNADSVKLVSFCASDCRRQRTNASAHSSLASRSTKGSSSRYAISFVINMKDT